MEKGGGGVTGVEVRSGEAGASSEFPAGRVGVLGVREGRREAEELVTALAGAGVEGGERKLATS